MGCFGFLALIPSFFLSSLFVMLLWGAISPDLGIKTIGYPMAMLVTFTLWLAVAPMVAAGRGAARRAWRPAGPESRRWSWRAGADRGEKVD